MASIAGILATTNLGAGQILEISMDPRLVTPDAENVLVTSILNEMGTRIVENPVFQGEESPHFEVRDPVRADSTVGASAGATKVINVTDATKFNIDYVVILLGINALIISIDTGANTMVVDPQDDTETIPALTAATDTILISTIAMEEGYDLGTLREGLRRNRTNFIQEFSSSFGITETMMASAQYTDQKNRVAEETMKHKLFVDRAIEGMVFFGEKKEDTSGTFSKRFSGGFAESTTNVLNYTSAGITNAQMQTISQQAFLHGSSRKILFADGELSRGLMNLLEATKQTPQTETILGVKFIKYETVFGEFLIKYHSRLDNLNGGFGGVYMDPAFVKLAVLKGWAMRARFNIVLDGSNKQTNEVSAKQGLDRAYEESHGLLVGT